MLENEFSQIDSHSIYLRGFTLNDSKKVFEMSIESGLKMWIPDQVYENQIHAERVLKFLIQQYEKNSGPHEIPIVFGICSKKENELIGHVGLSPYNGDVEIGYAVEEKQQNRGFATEAIMAMTKWAFQKFPLPYIWGIVSAENVGSCKALEKARFVLVHEERRNFHKKNTLVKNYKKHFEGA